MNKQQVMQLMSQRLKLSPDEMQALQNGDFFTVAQSRLAHDPMALSMLQMMREQAQARAQPEVVEPQPPPARRRSALVDDDVEELEQALRNANTTLRYLAQLFGACRCWGQNPQCPRCDGDGKPGTRPSTDPQRFLRWVTPGLRALGYEIVPAARPAAATTVSSPDHAKED
jgi:hypothetical protein